MIGAPPPHIRVSGAAPNAELSPSDVARIERCVLQEPRLVASRFREYGFEWDTGNADKNWDLHKVTRGEAEGVFFNRPFIVAPDSGHSQREPRYAALGRTDRRRLFAVIFTVRGALLRVISARDMSRRERRIYEQASSKA
jgi:uncharacterized protein